MLEESRRSVFDMHRDGVLWYLGRKLEEVGELQRGMMERRLEREMEKGRSVLYKVKGSMVGESGDGDAGGGTKAGINGHAGGGGGGGSGGSGYGGKVGAAAAAMEDESRGEIEQQLSPEQLQLFARENQDMLKHYEDTLDQVRYAHPFSIASSQNIVFSLTSHHHTGQQNAPCSRSPSCKPH